MTADLEIEREDKTRQGSDRGNAGRPCFFMSGSKGIPG